MKSKALTQIFISPDIVSAKLARILHGLINFLQGKTRNILAPIVSLNSLYANLQKSHPIRSETTATQEAEKMLFLPESKVLQEAIYSFPDIYTVILDKVIYCPKYNLLLTNSRRVISECISADRSLQKSGTGAFLWLREVEQMSGVYSIFRSKGTAYYHTLIDRVPRLFLLDQPEYQKFDEIKLLFSSQPTKIESYFLQRLLPENVKIALVDSKKLYLTEKFIFPTFLTRRFAGYLPSSYLRWFAEKIHPQRARNKVNRIFISRGEKACGRSILNENELLSALKPYGFKKYVLENMSIEEQITLFYDAEWVIAAHGGGLSNIIYSEKIKVLEIFSTQFVFPHYYYLCKSLGHTYRYLCGLEKNRDANFRVNVSDALDKFEDLDIQIAEI